jgi:hypothetical protein
VGFASQQCHSPEDFQSLLRLSLWRKPPSPQQKKEKKRKEKDNKGTIMTNARV